MAILILILIICALALFLMDAFKANVLVNINRTALGLALMTLVVLIGQGVLTLP